MHLLTVPLLLLALLSSVHGANFTNPLRSRDGSDPFIVWDGAVGSGYYYLLTTTWNDVRLTRATTLEGLKRGETRVVWTDTSPSRCCNVWAPEIHRIDGTWYIYYSAGNKQNLDGQRSHVLKGGTTTWSNYTYAAQLTPDWGIDGTVLRVAGREYFVWSCFPRPNLQSLCIAAMASAVALEGATRVLSEPTLAWERVGNPVNEGAAAMYHGNKTFLAYSGSYCWTDSYQLGLLTYKGAGDPLLASSWVKTGPVFSSANGNFGTGHNGFFASPDGTEIWNVYHATTARTGACDGNRYTAAKRVNWNADGSPDFGKADTIGTVLAGPSGE
ncbi:glycosyl hydrolase [Cercophora newfieldiana]|uniref:Glycosyl hydrolase n=1 Tax=Cercophora newfieldiana TaxID=92897 RepID=A0AA39Y852_9PEZI|nr:glycosyl hydrolase [Cercophora newfieldiana]